MSRSLRIAALAAVAAFVLVPAALAGTVTTVPGWNGSDEVDSYGWNDFSTPTYGQTVLGTGETLQSFTFYIDPYGGAVEARGGVGVWDGSEITDLTWLDSSAQTVTGDGYEAVTFTPGVTLQAGQEYVLFATALQDGGDGDATWGALGGNPYAGGTYVYTNGGWDDGSCPSVGCLDYLGDAWDGLDGGYAGSDADLAFSMQLGDGPLQVNRLGYCSAPGNTTADGAAIAPGTFLDLAAGQPNTDPHYTGASLALYYDGIGLSCDRLPGYAPTGELVGLSGHGDDAGGLYPFMAKK